MRRLGEVTRVREETVLARSPDDGHPEIGTEAVDETLDTVGRVVDVFGPVERPYLVITLEGERSPASLLNEPVYGR
ncbi:MAG: H/ACA ribonucleoprotein complex subunit GAR1 [Halobacteriales archaeon]